MMDGLESRTPQSLRPLSSATAIRIRMEAEQKTLRFRTDLWAEKVLKNFREASQMFPDEAANSNMSNRPTVMPEPGKWEPVPWWMFWPEGRRRKSWRLLRGCAVWTPKWEYQHVAYVAREALEDYCAPRHPAGATQAAPTTDRNSSYIAGYGSRSPHPDYPRGR